MYICRNGNKILNDLPIWENGRNKGKINRKAIVGMNVDVEYRGKIYYNIKILKYIKCKPQDKLMIEYDGYIKKDITYSTFIQGSFGGILNKDYGYLYDIGDNVNGLKIINRGYITNIRNERVKAYQVKCKICGFNSGEHYKKGEHKKEYWVKENSLKSGDGCPCCSNHIVIQGINDMYTTNHWMVELGVDKEFAKTHTSVSGAKALWKCPDCGNKRYINASNIRTNKSIRCYCGDGFSYPEKFMYSILKQLDVDFETQYSPSYFKRKEKSKTSRKFSDFHIPKNGLIIETDGGLGHKGGIIHSMSDKTIEECIEVDRWKDEQHNLHGLHTVRINCFESNMEYIKNNILNSELVDYFNFENIDWEKANEFAWFSNLRKEVCKYWNNKETWETTKSLENIFGISYQTITKYIKKGTELGWCNYNPKEEIKKACSINGKMRGKPVEIFKDGISLGIFPSCHELERQSEKLFGVKLYHSNMGKFCQGKYLYNNYKGFTFKYIEDNNEYNKIA